MLKLKRIVKTKNMISIWIYSLLSPYADSMELTPDQQKIVDLVNQLPDNVKQEMLSQMHISTDTTKKDLKDVMLSSDAHNKEKDMIEKYTATQKIVEEFYQLCLSFSEKEELNRLRKALKRAEMERDILKKAAAFFAQEQL